MIFLPAMYPKYHNYVFNKTNFKGSICEEETNTTCSPTRYTEIGNRTNFSNTTVVRKNIVCCLQTSCQDKPNNFAREKSCKVFIEADEVPDLIDESCTHNDIKTENITCEAEPEDTMGKFRSFCCGDVSPKNGTCYKTETVCSGKLTDGYTDGIETLCAVDDKPCYNQECIGVIDIKKKIDEEEDDVEIDVVGIDESSCTAKSVLSSSASVEGRRESVADMSPCYYEKQASSRFYECKAQPDSISCNQGINGECSPSNNTQQCINSELPGRRKRSYVKVLSYRGEDEDSVISIPTSPKHAFFTSPSNFKSSSNMTNTTSPDSDALVERKSAFKTIKEHSKTFRFPKISSPDVINKDCTTAISFSIKNTQAQISHNITTETNIGLERKCSVISYPLSASLPSQQKTHESEVTTDFSEHSPREDSEDEEEIIPYYNKSTGEDRKLNNLQPADTTSFALGTQGIEKYFISSIADKKAASEIGEDASFKKFTIVKPFFSNKLETNVILEENESYVVLDSGYANGANTEQLENGFVMRHGNELFGSSLKGLLPETEDETVSGEKSPLAEQENTEISKDSFRILSPVKIEASDNDEEDYEDDENNMSSFLSNASSTETTSVKKNRNKEASKQYREKRKHVIKKVFQRQRELENKNKALRQKFENMQKLTFTMQKTFAKNMNTKDKIKNEIVKLIERSTASNNRSPAPSSSSEVAMDLQSEIAVLQKVFQHVANENLTKGCVEEALYEILGEVIKQ